MAEVRWSNESLYRPEQVPPPPDGCVWVEWVGEISPLDDPVIGFNLITNRYTEDQKAVIRGLCMHRVARVAGYTTKTIQRGQIPALSRDWSFGDQANVAPGHPKSFMQALPYRDADAIKSSDDSHQFIVWRERDGAAIHRLSLPRNGDVRLVEREAYSNLATFNRAMGW